MTYVVVGAGAVGGTIGARLHEAGHEVVLVARGAHLTAIAAAGLHFEEPGGSRTLRIPVAAAVADVPWRPGDVAVLACKSQHSEGLLDELRQVAPWVTVACAQNGVANERLAARRFRAVQAMLVMLPAEHLEPGCVRSYSDTVPGILDVGAFPDGVTEDSERISGDLRSAGFSSTAQDSVMRWKYRKLMDNLGNAAHAVCPADDPDVHRLVAAAREEGARCLAAAGIEVATREERQRRGGSVSVGTINGHARTGGSTWQSLRRGAGSVESRYLNGEVVELGDRYGVPTPVNRLLLTTAEALALAGAQPGSRRAADLLRQIPQDVP